ncbi:MAG: ArsA-related P-loop ATPase [Pseudomonadota bacterium]
MILGTGGVGKTTFAAAIGVGLARHRRTLVITVDPARRLRDAIDRVRGADLPTIDVLDVHETMERLVRFLAPDEDTATRIIENRFFHFLGRNLPGIHHYSGIFRVLEALDQGGFDVVVVDTPPMGHAIEFLTAADRIVRVGRLLGAVTGSSSRRFSLRSGLPRLVIRTFRRFLGDDFAEDLFEFFDMMHRVLVRFDEQALAGRELLTSDEAALLVVSAPDRDASGDTDRLLEDLPKGHRILAEILNRVLPLLEGDPEEEAQRLLAAMEAMPGARLWLPSKGRDVRRSVVRSLRWYGDLWEAQQQQIEATLQRAAALGIQKVLRVPVVPEGLESAEGLRALYDAAEPC